MAPPLPFSVNQYLRPPAMSPSEFMVHVDRWGFDGVGITQDSLQQQSASDMARELAARRLRVSSLNTAGFFLQAGDGARLQHEQNLRLLDQALELGGARLNVIVGASASLPLHEARAQAADRLQAFAGEAAARGVQLMVEPLHHLNVRTKSCFNSLSQLVPLFERIPGLVLNADLFHLWWDPDLDGLLRGRSLPVGLLQICDVAMSPEHPVPRRVPLGEGVIPWSDHVAAFRAAFPGVPIELELFADQLPDRPLAELLAHSAAALSTLEEK